MVERTFRYQPVLVPSAWMSKEDLALFAATHPQHHSWLEQNTIGFGVRLYRWPEWLMRILHIPLGEFVCEMNIQIDAAEAERFAEFSGLRPD